jgi:TolB-like protein
MEKNQIIFAKLLWILVFFVFFIGSLVAAAQESSQNEDLVSEDEMIYKKILLLDLYNISGEEDYDYLSQTIADIIHTKMDLSAQFDLVDRDSHRHYWSSFAPEQLYNAVKAAEIGSALSTDSIIIGKYLVSGDTIVLFIQAIDVETGRVQASYSGQGPANDIELFDTLDMQAQKISDKLQEILPPIPAREVRQIVEREEIIYEDRIIYNEGEVAIPSLQEAMNIGEVEYENEFLPSDKNPYEYLEDQKPNLWLTSIFSLPPFGAFGIPHYIWGDYIWGSIFLSSTIAGGLIMFSPFMAGADIDKETWAPLTILGGASIIGMNIIWSMILGFIVPFDMIDEIEVNKKRTQVYLEANPEEREQWPDMEEPQIDIGLQGLWFSPVCFNANDIGFYGGLTLRY